MRIRIHSPSGYHSLITMQFPMTLEAYRIEHDGTAFVKASVLRELGADTDDGDYVFLEEEYTLVEEERTLADCFGENPLPEALEANKRAADASMQDMITISGTFVQNVADAGRKDKLISLVKDYGSAINDGCYESECGTMQAMFAAHEEEKRLLKEIIKMIEEGV